MFHQCLMFHRYLHPYHIGLQERKDHHIGLHERKDQRFKDTCFKIAAAHIFHDIKAFKARMEFTFYFMECKAISNW